MEFKWNLNAVNVQGAIRLVLVPGGTVSVIYGLLKSYLDPGQSVDRGLTDWRMNGFPANKPTFLLDFRPHSLATSTLQISFSHSPQHQLILVWQVRWTRYFIRVNHRPYQIAMSGDANFKIYKVRLNPISTGGCFPPHAQWMAQNSTTEQASTLKLGNFSKLGIRKIFSFIN